MMWQQQQQQQHQQHAFCMQVQPACLVGFAMTCQCCASSLLWYGAPVHLRQMCAVCRLLVQTVLRRLKCWEGITTLRSSIGRMLDGSVNALLMPVQDFTQIMRRAATAVADMSELVLQPPATAPMYWSQESKRLLQQEQQQVATAGSYAYDISSSRGSGGWQQRQRQQADACVLQLLLSFRVLELLAALIDLAGVHGSRLAAQLEQQQPQGADEPLQQQPSSAALQQQLQALASEQAALLASLQVLLSGLSCCSAGWAYLRASSPGLEALARAISAVTKVRRAATVSAGSLLAATCACGGHQCIHQDAAGIRLQHM
jgi:hypothetical protein